jgi:acyl-CoA dehydrogenase
MLELLFGGNFGAAVAGAATVESVGQAFLTGYRHALRALVPSLPADKAVCLCATEEGGGYPRAIQSTFREAGGGWQLDGHKKWVTGASQAELLLVVASTGTDDQGRNRLRLGLVGAHQPGVTLHPMPPTPFVPEIQHAEVTFEAVFVEELLEGDGYERYLKPFRTVEDTYVFGAVLGYLWGRSPEWPRPFRERLLAALAGFEKVAVCDPSSREVHLLLAGALQLGRQLADEAAQHMDAAARELWQRDSALLNVAGKARQARADAAWEKASG